MIHNHHVNSLEAKERLYSTLFPLQPNGEFDVLICRHDDAVEATKEDRKEAQNDLMWVWNGKKANHTGHKANFIHGLDKLEILLPMYKSWGGAALKRADYIQNIIDHLPEFEMKVIVAYDMVRTKNLSIKRMAEYLTEVQIQSAKKGIRLESNSDLEFKSLMSYAEAKR